MADGYGSINFCFDFKTGELVCASLQVENEDQEKVGRRVFERHFGKLPGLPGMRVHNFNVCMSSRDTPAKKERTGWRDERLSRLHREYGIDIPMTDVDFLALEYDTGMPAALIEYKTEGAKIPTFNHPSFSALRWICGRAGMPLFIVFYSRSLSFFRVEPWNFPAREMFPSGVEYNRTDYFSWLFKLRKRVPPLQLIERNESLVIPEEGPIDTAAVFFDYIQKRPDQKVNDRVGLLGTPAHPATRPADTRR